MRCWASLCSLFRSLLHFIFFGIVLRGVGGVVGHALDARHRRPPRPPPPECSIPGDRHDALSCPRPHTHTTPPSPQTHRSNASSPLSPMMAFSSSFGRCRFLISAVFSIEPSPLPSAPDLSLDHLGWFGSGSLEPWGGEGVVGMVSDVGRGGQAVWRQRRRGQPAESEARVAPAAAAAAGPGKFQTPVISAAVAGQPDARPQDHPRSHLLSTAFKTRRPRTKHAGAAREARPVVRGLE